MNPTVSERLLVTSERFSTALCCGLDPDPRAMMERGLDFRDSESVYSFLLAAVDLTCEIVCAYKIQKAFFDILPDGHQLLRCITRHIRSRCPDTPVILDCKAGDVGNTMRAYYSYAFDLIGVDALMLNPLLGGCVWRELIYRPETAGCIMIRTSNPEAQEFQDLLLYDGTPFWYHVIRRLAAERARCDLFPVFSHTDPRMLQSFRAVVPDDVPILFAGYGAQNIDPSGMKYLANSAGNGVLANSSRALLFSSRGGERWPEGSISARANEARRELNELLEGRC